MTLRRVLLFTPLLVALGLGLFLWKGLSLNPQELPSAMIGKPFPAFAMPSLANAERTLTEADITGEPMLVNVWATWCPSCKEEHDQLNLIKNRDGVKIVGINYKDERQAALEWLDRYEDPYALSIYDVDGKLGLDLGVYGAPETYVVDAQGIIRHRYAGPVDEQVWQQLKAIMAEL